MWHLLDFHFFIKYLRSTFHFSLLVCINIDMSMSQTPGGYTVVQFLNWLNFISKLVQYFLNWFIFFQTSLICVKGEW